MAIPHRDQLLNVVWQNSCSLLVTQKV